MGRGKKRLQKFFFGSNKSCFYGAKFVRPHLSPFCPKCELLDFPIILLTSYFCYDFWRAENFWLGWQGMRKLVESEIKNLRKILQLASNAQNWLHSCLFHANLIESNPLFNIISLKNIQITKARYNIFQSFSLKFNFPNCFFFWKSIFKISSINLI